MHFPDGRIVDLHADDLIELSQLGRGTYGFVTLNKHTQSELKFAIKHIKQQDDPGVSFIVLCDCSQKTFWSKLEILVKTKTFGQKSKSWSKLKSLFFYFKFCFRKEKQ